MPWLRVVDGGPSGSSGHSVSLREGWIITFCTTQCIPFCVSPDRWQRVGGRGADRRGQRLHLFRCNASYCEVRRTALGSSLQVRPCSPRGGWSSHRPRCVLSLDGSVERFLVLGEGHAMPVSVYASRIDQHFLLLDLRRRRGVCLGFRVQV